MDFLEVALKITYFIDYIAFKRKNYNYPQKDKKDNSSGTKKHLIHDI